MADTLTPVPVEDGETRYVPPAASGDEHETVYFGRASGDTSGVPAGPDDSATIYRGPGGGAPLDQHAGGDTTGLPPSAFGVRHTLQPPGAAESEAELTRLTSTGDVEGQAELTRLTSTGDAEGEADLTRLTSTGGGAGVRDSPLVKAATGPLSISQQFGARYIIVKLLGIGGMGAVYQAWDSELSVMVALKVVRPEVTRDPAAARDIERRFKQELLLARQVTHRNVVRIHDMGEIDGIKYITMPFIEGDDLGSVARKAGGLPVATVMTIARQVASGLQAAHDAGVVHRDLKPANIMIAKDAEAIIMDFGIARTSSPPQLRASSLSAQAVSALPSAVQAELTRSSAEATVAGAVVGTVAYMAPEQARGEDVDQRADIYAFGLILYDLLSGRRRVEEGGGAVQELQKRLEQPPPALKSLVPAIPEPLSRFVARCVESDAAKRFATTADMVAELDRLDDRGKFRPVKRVVGLPLAALVAMALLALSGGVYWYTRPPVQHDNVVVVIADMANQTGDPAFDHTLEPVMERVLDDSQFITAYERTGMRSFGVSPTSPLDEEAARKVALAQGLGVVVSGAIRSQGGGYQLAVKARRTVTGEELANEQTRVGGKEQVLAAATSLMGRVKSALGDEDSESAKQVAMASMSATSLDVVRPYAAAVAAASANRFDEALQLALKTVQIDKNFGLGYLVASIQSSNLGRPDDERKYLDLAMQHLDGMTERERYHVRGSKYLADGDYQQCVKEFSEAIARYRADIGGRNQLALCLSHQREMRKAVEVMREVVKILPSQPLFRDNLALYLNYAGDFANAEKEAREVKGSDPYATLAIAFAQLGQGQRAEARKTYETLAGIRRRGKSSAAAGLGDLAAYEGRFDDAVRILRAAVADDLAAEDTESAAAKLMSIASAELSRGRNAAAIAAAEEGLRYGHDVRTRFLAARTFAEAGDVERARPLVEALDNEYFEEPRAYAKIVQGVLALKRGDARRAVISLREATQLFDTWIGQFDLGRASLEAGLYPQADSAFDACLNTRRGEALALFVDEQPTFAYLAPVYYYLGRARQELKSARYAESYRDYIALRGDSKEDVLLPEVRRRAGS